MAEEVIDLLARIPGLKVIGRTSSFQFRDKSVDTRLIGTTLGAAYVLEGSVRRSADAIRVTAQLIDTRDGAHRWSDTVDTKSDDVLQVQDVIAAGIARALQLTVQNVPAPHQSTTNSEAYDLYLRGLHFLDRYTAEGCEQAAAAFQQALELDPKYVAAEIGMARAYDFMGQNAWIPPKIAFERAREAADRALVIDPDSAAAHIRLANVHLVYDWDWAAAEREVAAAFKLGARDPEAFVVAGTVATVHRDWDQAIRLQRQALAQDPLNAQAYLAVGWYSYARMGRYAEAETAIRRALQIDPGEGSGHFFLAITMLVQGRPDDALKAANQETLDDGQLEASAAIYHALNRKVDSDAFLARSIEHNANTWASAIAKVYAFRGESDKALEWLNRAYEQRDEDLYFIAGDPLLRGLERDPRYIAFLQKMNLPAP
jgi:tetratricopeptide (TPR) repeat protein